MRKVFRQVLYSEIAATHLHFVAVTCISGDEITPILAVRKYTLRNVQQRDQGANALKKEERATANALKKEEHAVANALKKEERAAANARYADSELIEIYRYDSLALNPVEVSRANKLVKARVIERMRMNPTAGMPIPS